MTIDHVVTPVLQEASSTDDSSDVDDCMLIVLVWIVDYCDDIVIS